jgi:hypothetical protein
MPISGWAGEILDKVPCAQNEVEVDLVITSVADLGFKEGGFYGDICTRAKDHGLQLCPAEVGPALRLKYVRQTWGEPLAIAMTGVIDSGGCPTIFAVMYGNHALRLEGCPGRAESIFNANFRFVFVLPRH